MCVCVLFFSSDGLFIFSMCLRYVSSSFLTDRKCFFDGKMKGSEWLYNWLTCFQVFLYRNCGQKLSFCNITYSTITSDFSIYMSTHTPEETTGKVSMSKTYRRTNRRDEKNANISLTENGTKHA